MGTSLYGNDMETGDLRHCLFRSRLGSFVPTRYDTGASANDCHRDHGAVVRSDVLAASEKAKQAISIDDPLSTRATDLEASSNLSLAR